MNILKKLTLALFLATSLAACTITSGSSIVTGSVHQPTEISEIKILRQAPEAYQELGIVFSSAGHDFRSEQAVLESAIEKLKKEAAKLGANGVILTKIKPRGGSTSVGTMTTYGSAGMGVGTVVGVSGDRHTRLEGLAILTP